jgi:hypothetical protein
VFAELYFNAYDDYVAGRPVPLAWRIAFDNAASPNLHGIGDLLLGMNAHISRDLPYPRPRRIDEDERELTQTRPRSRERVPRPGDRSAPGRARRRYDPTFTVTDGEPSPIDEVGALQGIRTLRENAWRKAKRLVAARTSLERRLVSQTIEAEAAAFALSIVGASTVPGYGQVRDPHCAAAH